MITVSLFSGCGGLDYGFEAAGCDVVLRNDIDGFACKTLRHNTQQTVIEAPIEDLDENYLRKVLGDSKDAVDLIIGGPPCQPFSKSAFWANGDTLRLKDPRANTLAEYFRVVQILRPRAFLMENVRGINFSGKEEGFKFILDRIKEVNNRIGADYRPVWKILNAADYGVPQVRERFFLIAMRKGCEFRFPEPTHGAHGELDNNAQTLFKKTKQAYLTAWDAIHEQSPDPGENLKVGGKWADLLSSIPEGENYLWHTDRKGGLPLFGWRTRYWSFLLKLAKNRPSWTIQAQPGSAIGPFHWANRKLSWREMAAIQTFPRTFRIDSPRVEIQRQIGNAVPSLLAEVLARSIVSQLTGKTDNGRYNLEIVRAPFIPSPEEVSLVSPKYLSLSGTHDPHPGTGRGRSYQGNVL